MAEKPNNIDDCSDLSTFVVQTSVFFDYNLSQKFSVANTIIVV